MKFYRLNKFIPVLITFLFITLSMAHSQNRDQLPAEFREYTNPEELVTFDRSTSFSRALDVINEFAQKYRNKLVIDRNATEGDIGISIPKMHWMDALKMILRVKQLELIEQPEYYEIVKPSRPQEGQMASASGSGGERSTEVLATTKSQEVRINAIFFEGNRRALQEIGVDWSTITENVPDAILDVQSGGQSGGGQGGGGGGGGQGGGEEGVRLPNSVFEGPFVQVNSKGAQNVSQNVFNSLFNFGEIGNSGIEVQALFSAFEADNLGEILASPSVKVLDGQPGRIQVGQDFSIKQRDFAGNVVEEFFSVGTILEVTPHVIQQNDTTFIHLEINAERSSAQPDPVSTIINKQQAETQALLLDGEATVIAGLYNTEAAEVRRGVPILKDLPGWFFGLRYLFGYTSKDYQTRELVILLQADLEPRINQRVHEEDYKDKYEILQEERWRMQDEIERAQKILKDEQLEEEIEEVSSVEKEEEKNQDTNTGSNRMTAMQDNDEPANELAQKIEKQNNAEMITQTEMGLEEVSLNFGNRNYLQKDISKRNENWKQPLSDELNGEKSAQPDQLNAESGKATVRGITEEENQNSTTGYTYYLIGGSFKARENAQDFQTRLRDQGYEASIVTKENSSILFVAYGGYYNKSRAKADLADIQKYENSGAWLFRGE